MTNRLSLVAALAALLPLGCYTGVEAQAESFGAPASSQGDAPDPTTGDNVPDDSGDDDGDSDPSGDEPEPEPAEDPFEVPNHEVRLLPYNVRMNNLANLLGVEQDHFIFDELHVRRTLLGDHDHANGVAPNLAWNPSKMGFWVKGLKPVCNSAQWLERYPNLSADPAPLLREVLAREPNAEELAAYQELASNAVSTVSADELTCLAALSSLDFVAQ